MTQQRSGVSNIKLAKLSSVAANLVAARRALLKQHTAQAGARPARSTVGDSCEVAGPILLRSALDRLDPAMHVLALAHLQLREVVVEHLRHLAHLAAVV